jgi:hypothetical protein
MRQIMPHRNNIAMHRTKCKMFFGYVAQDGLRAGKVGVVKQLASVKLSSVGFDIIIRNNAL